MPDYTVRDSQSGRTVTFRWNGTEPPTDADLAEVFAAANQQQGPQVPPTVMDAAMRPPQKTREDIVRETMDLVMPKYPGLKETTRRTLDLLPIAGGAAGAALGGGWGSVPLAGLGGAAGEAARQMGHRALGDEAPLEPSQVLTSGAVQGGAQALGVGSGELLPVMARRLYQYSAKPSVSLRREFPTAVQDALTEGVPIGARGTAKAGRLLTEAGQQTDEAIQSAQAAGAPPVNMRTDVVPALARTAGKVRQQPLRAGDLQTVRSTAQQLVRENPNPIPLTQAQTMKQAAQRQASQGYRQIDAGADINRVPLDAQMDVARGLRGAIEQRVPEVAGLNARTQRLMGVEKMAGEAEGRIANTLPTGLGMQGLIATGLGGAGYAASGGDAGTGIAAALASLAITNPLLASRLAIMLNAGAKGAAQSPQAARAAMLMQQLGDE